MRSAGTLARDVYELAGMNAFMLRDVGAETSLGPHASANRELLYPRL